MISPGRTGIRTGLVTGMGLAALCLALAGPVAAQSVGEKTGVNSVLGVSPSTQDFVTQAVISDLFEKQSSQLAEERGDDKTKAFARKMIADHGTTTDGLKALVDGGKVKADWPTALDSSHQSKLDTLKGLKGDDFVKQYRSDQVTAHKNAVDLYKRYADGGDNADLKAFAAKMKPTLDAHLKLAEELPK